MTKIETTTQPRLLSFKLEHPVIHAGPRQLTSGPVRCYAADPSYVGWAIEIRGAAAFLVSPRGWKQGIHPNELTGKGFVTTIGPIPMLHVTCVWEGDQSAADAVQRFTSPPFSQPAPTRVDEAAIDPKELGDA